MKSNGFYGIGILNAKHEINYGSLFRTAQIFNADFVFIIGERFKIQSSDTMKSWRHIPTYSYKDFEDFNKHRPFNCVLIGVELDERSIPIKEFKHPKVCCYLLGAEDNGLTTLARDTCQQLIQLPGERSLNVAVAGSIVLFDRLNKNGI